MRQKDKWDFSFETSGDAMEYLALYDDPRLFNDETDMATVNIELPTPFIHTANLQMLSSAIEMLSRDEIVVVQDDLSKALSYLSLLAIGLGKYTEVDKTSEPPEKEKAWRGELRKQLGKSQRAVSAALRKSTIATTNAVSLVQTR